MNLTLGILSNDFILSTSIMDKIIIHTKANTDQEHIKMNIFINNKLLEKNKTEIKDIIEKLEQSNITHLLLILNNKELINYIKNITTIPIIDSLDYKIIIQTLGGIVK